MIRDEFGKIDNVLGKYITEYVDTTKQVKTRSLDFVFKSLGLSESDKQKYMEQIMISKPKQIEAIINQLDPEILKIHYLRGEDFKKYREYIVVNIYKSEQPKIDDVLKYQYLLDHLDPDYQFHLKLSRIEEHSELYQIFFEKDNIIVYSLKEFRLYGYNNIQLRNADDLIIFEQYMAQLIKLGYEYYAPFVIVQNDMIKIVATELVPIGIFSNRLQPKKYMASAFGLKLEMIGDDELQDWWSVCVLRKTADKLKSDITTPMIKIPSNLKYVSCKERLDQLCQTEMPDSKKLWSLLIGKNIRVADFKIKPKQMCDLLYQECADKVNKPPVSFSSTNYALRLKISETLHDDLKREEWQVDFKCYMKYQPTNAELKEKFGTDKLKVISLSLFRSETDRNQRAMDYFNGALAFAGQASKLFKDYVIRIYVDFSLFDKSSSETKSIWQPLMEQLYKHANIQIVKYYCPLLAEKANYHFGYIGSFVRMFSMWDPDVSLSVFRDIDSIPYLKDYQQIVAFESSSYKIHKYIYELYRPTWVDNLKNIIRPEIGVFAAGLFAIKGPQPIKTLDQLYTYITINKTLDWKFGIDEMLINYLIYKILPLNYENDIQTYELIDLYSQYRSIKNVVFEQLLVYYGLSKSSDLSFIKDMITYRMIRLSENSRVSDLQQEIYELSEIMDQYTDTLTWHRMLVANFTRINEPILTETELNVLRECIRDMLTYIPMFNVPNRLHLVKSDLKILVDTLNMWKNFFNGKNSFYKYLSDRMVVSPQLGIYINNLGHCVSNDMKTLIKYPGICKLNDQTQINQGMDKLETIIEQWNTAIMNRKQHRKERQKQEKQRIEMQQREKQEKQRIEMQQREKQEKQRIEMQQREKQEKQRIEMQQRERQTPSIKQLSPITFNLKFEPVVPLISSLNDLSLRSSNDSLTSNEKSTIQMLQWLVNNQVHPDVLRILINKEGQNRLTDLNNIFKIKNISEKWRLAIPRLNNLQKLVIKLNRN